MAKDERKINRAVAVQGYTRSFVAGDEDALAQAIEEDKDGAIDVERLSKSGVLVGFGKATAESAQTRNKQRKADGEQADESAEDGELPEGEGTDAPKKVKPAKPEKQPRAARRKKAAEE